MPFLNVCRFAGSANRKNRQGVGSRLLSWAAGMAAHRQRQGRPIRLHRRFQGICFMPKGAHLIGNFAGLPFMQCSRHRIRQGNQMISLIYRRIILPQIDGFHLNLLCHLCFGIRAAKRQEVRGRGVGRHKISHAMAIRIAWRKGNFP